MTNPTGAYWFESDSIFIDDTNNLHINKGFPNIYNLVIRLFREEHYLEIPINVEVCGTEYIELADDSIIKINKIVDIGDDDEIIWDSEFIPDMFSNQNQNCPTIQYMLTLDESGTELPEEK